MNEEKTVEERLLTQPQELGSVNISSSGLPLDCRHLRSARSYRVFEKLNSCSQGSFHRMKCNFAPSLFLPKLAMILTALLFSSGLLKADGKTVKSGIAGSWHSSNPVELRKEIEKLFLPFAGEQVQNDIISLIVPHAGYSYSGSVAAQAISRLAPKCGTIVVLGPSHHFPFSNRFAVPRFDTYETPLGKIESDSKIISKLLESELFFNDGRILPDEHSVQIPLPLLQYRLASFKIVFLICSQADEETISKAGKLLSSLMKPGDIIVASSDFIHCGPRFGYEPFKENSPENLASIDMQAFKFIEEKNVSKFMAYVQKTGATICGASAISLLLSAVPRESSVALVKYSDSSSLNGDKINTVSYISATIRGDWKMNSAERKPESNSSELSEKEKETLLKLARTSIEYFFKNGKEPEIEELSAEIPPALDEQRAAFVTLHKNGHLRGCIGEIFPCRPLGESVVSNAVNAAFHDYRFKRLSQDELAEIDIEISALTSPKKVPSFSQIKLGTDGIVLQKRSSKAVFLPQVAPEQGWDLEETLTNLSMKAGLPPDAWKDGAEFLTFQAEVFGEKK